MIHNWAEEFHVRPRSAAIIEDDATFINNYLLLKPVRSLQSNPPGDPAGERGQDPV